jgi:hypothetical protein
MVTKLVSWFDINQASDETLQNKKQVRLSIELYKIKY